MFDWELYMTSFYFTITTIVTVGYGDITAISIIEKIVAVFLMITGVIAFSFATGTLASIIQNQDSNEAKLKEKMAILAQIQQEYNIKNKLFARLAKTIRYDHKKKSKNFNEFIDELPPKLRIKLTLKMHKKNHQTIPFLKDLDPMFLAWLGTVTRQITVQELSYIYKEGETILEVFFLLKGQVGFVLPRYHTKIYHYVEQGEAFGEEDLFGKRIVSDPLHVMSKKKNDLKRQFQAIAISSE